MNKKGLESPQGPLRLIFCLEIEDILFKFTN
jgi:hypothetical protein